MTVLLGATPAHAKTAHVQAYGGWATTDGAVLLGRVLEGTPPSGRQHHHRVTKLGSTAKAFLAGDVEDARVRVTDTASGKSIELDANGEGFFDARFPGPLAAGAHAFSVQAAKGKYRAPAVEVVLEVVDGKSAGFLVIVDIDDTITATGVTGSKKDLIVGTALRGASDMQPFPASVLVLRALADAGAQVIYLTASPVQLGPRLRGFLDASGFPAGPLLLRYWKDDGMGDPRAYKRARVDRLLADFPARQLILFGDNGEQDPELFEELAAATKRVAFAFVRATVPGAQTDARYRGVLLFSHFGEVARDLGRRGVIRWWLAQRIYLTTK